MSRGAVPAVSFVSDHIGPVRTREHRRQPGGEGAVEEIDTHLGGERPEAARTRDLPHHPVQAAGERARLADVLPDAPGRRTAPARPEA